MRKVYLTRIPQAGVSLIEVLITLIVLGMGLMSLAKFQGTVLQDNSLAKARTVAAHLAEQKLEDLRKYDELAIDAASPAGALAYTAIATNAGGTLASAPLASAPITISAVDYGRTWTVTNYCYPVAHNSQPVLGGACNFAYPDFKIVTVTVDWVDQDAQAQSVVLRTIINATVTTR